MEDLEKLLKLAEEAKQRVKETNNAASKVEKARKDIETALKSAAKAKALWEKEDD